VIHGVDYELRKKSIDYLTSSFDGYGIGGSLGSNQEELKNLYLCDADAGRRRQQKNKTSASLGADEEHS
jgi:queuine/archaeosine tRNA-ribosyltransferase